MYPGPLLGTIKGEVRKRAKTHDTTQVIRSRSTHPISIHTTLAFTPVQALRCRKIQSLPPAGRRAFSCPNQDKSLCLFASPSGKGSTHTSFTRWCEPPRGKHRQLARQVGVLHVFHRFPISFQMATHVSSISRSTVIWFGSLEFMSTGFGYDMILLSVEGPGGARVAPARPRAPRRPRHHASPPKKRRGQRRHHPSASSRPPVRARREVT